MMVKQWTHPPANEHPPYYSKYIEKVPRGNLIDILKQQNAESIQFLNTISPEKLQFRYAEGKWNIPEIIQHLIDAERIFCYRALRFARADKTELPAFEENDYAKNANVNERNFNDIVNEYAAVRNATLYLFNSFNDEIICRKGIANKNEISVRAIAYIIAGHELHHTRIIKERYLDVHTQNQ